MCSCPESSSEARRVGEQDDRALHALRSGDRPSRLVDFDRRRDIVGFDAYDAEAERYRLGDD